MAMTKLWTPALALAIAGSGAVWAAAQPKQVGRLSAEDFVEIYQLCSYCADGVDLGHENPAWTFTDDGTFETRAVGAA